MSVKRWLKILVAATVVLYLITIAVGIAGLIKLHGIEDNFCTFRGDLQRRVNEGNKFLAQHPHGTKGFPAGAIKVSIQNQERTLTALRGLSC
jgi:hypothetical protein